MFKQSEIYHYKNCLHLSLHTYTFLAWGGRCRGWWQWVDWGGGGGEEMGEKYTKS